LVCCSLAALSRLIVATSSPMSFPSIATLFFLITVTAPSKIYTLSLHDALPIYDPFAVISTAAVDVIPRGAVLTHANVLTASLVVDRKSTRLNSSHGSISYAVFCLKKKNVGLRNG